MSYEQFREQCAKAAGKDIDNTRYDDDDGFAIRHMSNGKPTCRRWRRAAAGGTASFSFEQNIAFHRSCALANIPTQKSVFATGFFEPWGDDKQVATRRSIVRAAAEIGRAMA